LVDIARDDPRLEALGFAQRWRGAFSGPDIRTRRPRDVARAPAPPAAVREAARRAPYPALAAAPAACRIAMPKQDLARAPAAPRLGDGLALRRVVVLVGALAIAAVVAAVLFQVLRQGGVSFVEWATIGLSTVLAGWVGFGFTGAAAGFVAALGTRACPDVLDTVAPITARTAILLPTYNEDPGLILAAVQAIAEDLRRLELAALYDVFILSDTRDEAVARAEAAGFLRLQLRLTDGPRAYYRRRAANTDRKAGNIGDWV
jgi:membrane glycosyltransferase